MEDQEEFKEIEEIEDPRFPCALRFLRNLFM